MESGRESGCRRGSERRFAGSAPLWGPESLAPDASDLLFPVRERLDVPWAFGRDARRGEVLTVKRFARIAAALSALASILLVSGAQTRW